MLKTHKLFSIQEASRSSEIEGCATMMQHSSNWTKLEPGVNTTDADKAPTYSLQSEAGDFECSVSGLRWVCKEKISFQYHFCSWGGHMERVESRQYMPAGPVIDVAVTAGQLSEMHLPHWVCIDDIPDKFAVLHLDDCGDFVEEVREVTASHVKLNELTYFPKAVVMKMGPPVKISCNVLLYYKPNTPFLKLHVFVIPNDPALQRKVDKQELCYGYEKITKPRPDEYLKMHHGFSLTADTDSAEIQPKKITLRYNGQDSNFYEVYIENPKGCFSLKLQYALSKKYEPVYEPVWTCKLQKDDHPKSGYGEGPRSSRGVTGVTTVDKHCE
ncbi:NACHT, LRR and PYD domains-containing protein 1 homolog isoform X2 [Simochromis diagramma]|uniref:NACHT, LRR and PYD domains-containing protein 1 homolog isoform X2 n=1 Tax=Simochromis diagramma TaxID=43689 RepID=UPI001A7EF6A5|nr:NACHT, LRR and PYD domains-containing protein 1 homolog isoform X2 [Simochromis diagramma]